VTRFLVTGATGFIGSAVVRRLTAEGHEIVAWRGRSDPIDLLTARDVEVARLAGDSDATHCIHCAWYTNHADYLVHDVNREWLKASLRLARACGDMRFVGLGTCLEYDLSAGEPCVEDESPLTPQTLYARCKRDLFEVLGEIGGDFAWARVFFVYGPGDRAGRLIPSMIERFRRGEAAAPTYGGLRRDYIHVDDLAAQIVRIATSEVSGAINTGTGEAPSLSEIFEAGGRAFGRPELAQANDNTGDQPWLIQGDLARFRDKIGEVQARDIAAGLMDMVR
jgi:nucleoside-diphosphate-sugar epimerase